MLLSDGEIRDLCVVHQPPMIEPFSEPVSGGGTISYGLTSAGYDVRLCGKEILTFHNFFGQIIDPKKFADPDYRRKMFMTQAELKPHTPVIIPPGGYILAQTHEYVRIPRNVSGRVVGKSTLARSGVLVNCTPMEPEWEGHLTLEIGNLTTSALQVYVMEGIAQFQFELINRPVQVSYRDKASTGQGKYQGQKRVTPAIVL